LTQPSELYDIPVLNNLLKLLLICIAEMDVGLPTVIF